MKRKDVIVILAVIFTFFIVYTRYFNPVAEAEEIKVPQVEEAKEMNKEEVIQSLNIQRHNSITNAVELVQNAVVSVNVVKTEYVRANMDPFQSFFLNYYNNVYKRNVKSIGSGVIISDDGYIITNSHVVENATKIVVILPDNRQFEAKLIGAAERQDIAVLKIESEHLPVAKLGTSSDLIIGEWVIALGNPYGFMIQDSKPSVSVGVISAVDRDFNVNQDGKIYREMIQTDAAINPGNSGGPLVNIYGKIIGINSFIFSETGSNIGMGFAIPIDRAMKLVEEIIKFGKVRTVWLDFGVREITPRLAKYLGLQSDDGIIVTNIDKNSPAGKAGIKAGDIIVGINDNLIQNIEEAQAAVSDVTVGDFINFTILRDGEAKTIVVKAVEQ